MTRQEENAADKEKAENYALSFLAQAVDCGCVIIIIPFYTCQLWPYSNEANFFQKQTTAYPFKQRGFFKEINTGVGFLSSWESVNSCPCGQCFASESGFHSGSPRNDLRNHTAVFAIPLDLAFNLPRKLFGRTTLIWGYKFKTQNTGHKMNLQDYWSKEGLILLYRPFDRY